ncbi:DEAD/DEAH box helicase family protein [Haloarchaeobius sp. HME9146]|uniref:DEAD/DEAH box helicase family protein n=1 Tax=Haloarchaeobius sp. HME9146 TaxID=2978732 RepID=UPI0021BEBA53|nr:DEAD/DEAH box helicase family protein [Haloarchaeobius sp. HME9146]MCT9096013.1 DEAD/DEAH box helicase family protein [Haloarchaeobius sp. HME9146]
MTVTLRYENGTIRVESDGSQPLPGVITDDRSGTGRVPGAAYAELVNDLDQHGIEYRDEVLHLPAVGDLTSTYELRDYQHEALAAWAGESADTGLSRRGCLELPTGSGKTVIAIAAIEECATPTLVVVPTLDLVDQWRTELATEFDQPIGQLGGGEQRIEPLTVSTYDSAYLRADDIGDRFELLVFDEVHHLGGQGYRDIGHLFAAPYRLGLTATFERPDGAHEAIEELVGPLVHQLSVADLAGDHLADYDVKRLRVELTPDERERYEEKQGVFTDYLAHSNIQLRSGSDYQELVKRSGTDPEARNALLAKQEAKRIMMGSEAKLQALADVLDRHRDDRVILFTAHNDLAYDISERFLVPVITHHTGTEERRDILDRFRDGRYSRVVTSNVLDEGVDVPDANVAVILSGTGSEREFTQRLGRILRPKADGGRALLYEIISKETAETRVADRRRG